MADACEVGSHLRLRILAALRPFMKSSDHQKEGYKVHLTSVRPIYAHLSRTGGNQEARTMGCVGDSVMPNISYLSSWRTKHTLPSCFRKFLVHNFKELEVLLMCNTCHCAETAHNVSAKTCKATVERAAHLPTGVTNPNTRLCS